MNTEAETGYFESGFLWFSSVCPGKKRCWCRAL